MKNKAIIAITIAGGTVIFLGLASTTDTSGLTPEIIKKSKYAMENEAVHLVGCQAINEPVSPKVIFPPIAKTFVSLPCATEVPPPTEAIEHSKRAETN